MYVKRICIISWIFEFSIKSSRFLYHRGTWGRPLSRLKIGDWIFAKQMRNSWFNRLYMDVQLLFRQSSIIEMELFNIRKTCFLTFFAYWTPPWGIFSTVGLHLKILYSLSSLIGGFVIKEWLLPLPLWILGLDECLCPDTKWFRGQAAFWSHRNWFFWQYWEDLKSSWRLPRTSIRSRV